MKLFLTLLLLLSSLSLSLQLVKWAVLVAGSSGYSNYRHQADICHAYKTLINKGLKAENIIVFAYDDIAYSSYNPFFGQIFNKPSSGAGYDVYSGCVIDYKGSDVTPTNYINVITGNSIALAGIGTGRVLQSTSADNVFIYFADHGGFGLIAFPSEYLYANDFQNALLTMHDNNMFNQLVYYLEACESGSMFLDFPTDKNIYGLTASNPYQSSYATYCSASDTVNGVNLNTCLGDLFSVSFLEDTDDANTAYETLQQQFLNVFALTSSSVVTQYGQLDFTNKNIGQWMGEKWTFKIRIPLLYKYLLWISEFDARLVKLQTYYRLWQASVNDNCRKQQFYEEAKQITKISLIFENVTKHLGLTTQDCDKQQILIKDYDCVKRLVEIFEKNCMSFGEYGLKFIYYIVYLCENDRQFEGVDAKAQFLIDTCGPQDTSFEDYPIEYFEPAQITQTIATLTPQLQTFDTREFTLDQNNTNTTDNSSANTNETDGGNNRLLEQEVSNNNLRRL